MLKRIFALAGVILPLVISVVGIDVTNQIYPHLINCYRGNNTQPWTSNSLQILIDLIRKVENAEPLVLNMRSLSVGLFHRMRLDGIERAMGIQETEHVTPYRASGLMTPKFQILQQLISNVPGVIKFEDYLTPFELCLLHRMISPSVEPYVRGDEFKTCPYERERMNYAISRNKVEVFENGLFFVVPDKISRCPIECGTVQTDYYGTLSPGVVIGAIAAGLQPQKVSIKEFISFQIKQSPYENLETMERRDTEKIRKLLRSLDYIDNAYAAGLAGDLAEVCLFQGPYYNTNVSIGLGGRWNDTDFPRVRFLAENHRMRWEMPESEILAGIDGFHLADRISTWISRLQRLRLSQVLEMFYSPRGIPSFAIENSNREKGDLVNSVDQQQHYQGFAESDQNSKLSRLFEEVAIDRDSYFNPSWYAISDSIDNACERKQILERISRLKLKEQTYFIAQILQFWTSSLGLEDDFLKKTCDAAVDRFFDKAQEIIGKLPNCGKIPSGYQKPTVDLTLIIDGSRTSYDNIKLISVLSEVADVSSFGSEISVIHGTSGQYLVSRTNGIPQAFDQLRNFTGEYPVTLSLSRSFASLVYPPETQTKDQLNEGIIGGMSKVILVISQSARVTQEDFDSAQRLLEGSLMQYPDMYFIFLTNNAENFKQLIKNVASQESSRKEQYKIIETSNLNPKSFSLDIANALRKVPKRLVVPSCNKTTRQKGEIDLVHYQYEDYASPNHELRYRISPHYLIQVPEIRVQFQGLGYGSITICQTPDSVKFHCHSLTDMDTVWFNITDPCVTDVPEKCPNIYFNVQMETSNMKCTDNDCQYPDQVRFLIRIQNMQCKTDGVNSSFYQKFKRCYEEDGTSSWVPSNLQVLLEVIRKVERTEPIAQDMKVLSTNLITWLREDGVELIPLGHERWAAEIFEINNGLSEKFQMLLKLMRNVDGKVNFDRHLKKDEFCTIHRLISSTIFYRERENERNTCPAQNENDNSMSSKKLYVFENGNFFTAQNVSQCPIESGVIRTNDFGTFSPGIVIASIASGLHPQKMSVHEFLNLEWVHPIPSYISPSNIIESIFAASLAGDLAEVCLQQNTFLKDRVLVGLGGTWNDTELPRELYLNDNDPLQWQMTDSEILAGLDGIHLADRILRWIQKMPLLRLSQILEMFYSKRGIPSAVLEIPNRFRGEKAMYRENLDKSNRSPAVGEVFNEEWYIVDQKVDNACGRKQVLNRLSTIKLRNQTNFLAQAILLSNRNATVDVELLRLSCNAAVDRFFDKATNLLSQLPKCDGTVLNSVRPTVDLTVILDGSRTEYESFKLISFLTESIDVSVFGSSIAVVSGETGIYMSYKTRSVLTTIRNLKEHRQQYPTTLLLTASLNSIANELQFQTENTQKFSPVPNVILVIAQQEQIDKQDLTVAKGILEEMLLNHRNLHFVFITIHSLSIEGLLTSLEDFATIDRKQFTIIHTSELNVKNFATKVTRALNKLPRRLSLNLCKNGSLKDIHVYEDFLGPNDGLSYQLSAHEIQNKGNVFIKFEGLGYGSFIVCRTLNSKSYNCHKIQNKGHVWFNISQPCQSDELGECPNILFTIEMFTSYLKCSDNSCRYPDQVKFQIHSLGEDCISGSVRKLLNIKILIFVLFCYIFN